MIDNDLKEIKESYEECAAIISNWKTQNKNDLINNYIYYEDLGDEKMRSAYISAIILKYWGTLYKWSLENGGSKFSSYDLYSWLIEGIESALSKRSWKDPSKEISKDPNGPDKVVNRCLFSIRGLHYYLSNLNKEAANYNSFSVDEPSKYPNGDDQETGYDNLEVKEDRSYYENLNIYQLVNRYLNNNQNIKAYILYLLAYSDCFINGEFKINKLYRRVREEKNLAKETFDIDIRNYQPKQTRKLVKDVLEALEKDIELKNNLKNA